MKENASFIIIFTAMMLTIAMLHGCTQLNKKDSSGRKWAIQVISTPDGVCEATVNVAMDDELTDDSVSLEHPNGN